MNNPIFIIGLPRSGSTLWHNIIARNEEICRIGEMHFLTPWRKDFRHFCKKHVGDLQNNNNVKKMVDLIFSQETTPGLNAWFWNAELQRVNNNDLKEKIYSGILVSDRSLGSIFKIFIENITVYSGLKRCCVKFPVYPSHIPQLLQWYPRCKIVHITRDPRATSISRTNDPGGTQQLKRKYPLITFLIQKIMIYFNVAQYCWTSRLHSKYKAIDNYALFRYEDLLAYPEKTIRKLCHFIEIDFDEKMLTPKAAQKSSVTGKRAKGFDKKAGTRWEKVISPFDKLLITMLTKRSMTKFGYAPNVHPIFSTVKLDSERISTLE
ncbi:MAG: sulfotransferase [Thermodesulfobacteriota bacterium]